MGGHDEEDNDNEMTKRHVHLDDQSMSLSNQTTPRSISWSRPKRSASAAAPRSSSTPRTKDEKEELERRELADAAFTEWLIRKRKLPRGPRCSPSRDQIVQHLREDARQRMLNIWLAKPHSFSMCNTKCNSNSNVGHMSRSYHSSTM